MAKARGFPPSRVGFPVSLRFAFYGPIRIWSYNLSTGFKYRQPDGMHILCCIDVPIMNRSTYRARPFPNIKRQRIKDIATLETAFRGGIPRVNLDKVPAIPLRFVCELAYKLTPPNLRDSFGKGMGFHHILDSQRLHTDRLVFTDQASGEFVLKVAASLSYPGMDSGYFFTGFCSIL